LKALTFHAFGDPSVLRYEDVADPKPGPGQAVVRTHAIGLNFADVYRRRGAYHLAGKPPYIAGYEAAGTIEVADGQGQFKPGQRVAFADSPYANAELVAVDVDKLIPLPDTISFDTAAALLLQGLTAQYLCRDSHRLAAGETVLVHAAAGGVGLLLVQMAKALDARVLALTSSAEKAQSARAAGADATLLYADDWVAQARQFAGGQGVDAVYDSVGSTLMQSLDASRIGGSVVFYGMAGGDPPLLDVRVLMDTSRTVTGGDLWNVLTSADIRRRYAAELFRQVELGQLNIQIAARLPLSRGADAHALLEGRTVSGKVLLIPDNS
jgi:NADPH:quinone reductase